MTDSSDVPSNPPERPKASLPRRSLASRASTQGASSTSSSLPPIPPPPPAQTVPVAIFYQLQMEHTELSRRLLDETTTLTNQLHTKQQEYEQLLAAKLGLEQEVAALKSAGEDFVISKGALEDELDDLRAQLDTRDALAQMHAESTSSLHREVDALNHELLALEIQASQEVDLLRLEKRSLERYLAATPPTPAGPDLSAPSPAGPLHPVSAAPNIATAWLWILLILLLLLLGILASIWALGWAERPGAFGMGGPDVDIVVTRIFALFVVLCGDLFAD